MTAGLPAALLLVSVLVAPGAAVAAPQQGCGTGSPTVDYRPWSVTRIAPERSWPISRGNRVTVAVLDSGINAQHPQLSGRVEAGTDLVRGKGTGDTDCNGHGSIVGGIIAADRIEGSGFYGVAPQATLLPIRIAEDTEKFDNGSPRIAAGIRYAVDHDASVINMSLTTDDSDELRAAVDYAHEHDVVLVAATGNGGTTERTYPASYPDVLGVAGVGQSGAPDSESNVGDWVDLAAPSRHVVGPAAVGPGYSEGEKGTSFAAPFVAGAAALLRSYRPDLPADAVMDRLEATADHPAGGRNEQVGYGVVNPYRALTQVLGAPGEAAATAGTIPAATDPAATADPVRTAALWAAVGLLVLVVSLLVLAAVVPAGRRRRWRPGLRGTLPAPRPARRQYTEYDPTAPPAVEPEPPPTTSARLPGKDADTTFTVDVHLG